MLLQKIEILKKLRENYPSMKVMFRDHVNNLNWAAEKLISELSDREKEEVNLRKSCTNEIIFDIENKLELENLKQKLISKGWSYEVWDTGSRGFHVSVKFDNLPTQELDVRNRIRKFYINEMKSDEALAKESQFVALEFEKHFKTGKIKTLSESSEVKVNLIPVGVIDYCKRALEVDSRPTPQGLKDEDFKDWWKTDPYLNYVLGKEIIDGERNNILFKNFAIGLVKSGLGKEDIVKFAERIVEHCPGKTLSEFMGWVEKAIVGDLTEYNKSELVKWSQSYNHPILYKLEQEINFDGLMTIKTLWDLLWTRKISCQDIWKDMCFYNLIGTVIDEREDDLRIHPIFSSDSGSGKDEGQNLVKEILDKLQYITFKPGNITDRTLVGSVNQTQLEINTKAGGEDSKKWKDPKEVGILGEANWIGFGESEIVFKPGPYNRTIQVILRQAMDKAREIEKGVSGEYLKLHTNASFSYVTFPMDDIITKIIHNGLFQRAIFYSRTLSEFEHTMILEHVNRLQYDTTWKENFNEVKYMNLLLEKLKQMKMWYDENKDKIRFTKDAEVFSNKLWREFNLREVEILTETDKKVLYSMERRMATTLSRLAKLSAISNFSSEIDIRTIQSGFNLIYESLCSVRRLLLQVDEGVKHVWLILSMVKGESRYLTFIHKELEDKVKGMKSPNARTKLIRRTVESGLVTEFQNNGKTMIAITEKGKEELGDG